MAKNEVVTAGGVPEIAADFGQYAGIGFENQSSNDVTIPYIGVIQAISPQVDDNNAAYIIGAKAGHMFNTVTQDLYNEVFFVPCCTENMYVEWVPRKQGGGYVGDHQLDSPIVEQAKATAEAFNKLKTLQGNDLIETFYIYGLLIEEKDSVAMETPVIFSFASSKIKAYKRIMTAIRTIKATTKPPLFAFRLKMTTVADKNSAGEAFKNILIEPAEGSLKESMNMPGTAHENLLVQGMEFAKLQKAGSLKVDRDAAGSGSNAPSEDEAFGEEDIN